MDDKLLIKKIQALLHDPPEKPLILCKIGHEDRAKEIMERLNIDAQIPVEVKTADHIASAADRVNIPKHERFIADFCGNPIIKHPLSSKELNLKRLPANIEEITSTVDKAIISLSDKYRDNTEQLYLSLWRELFESIITEGSNPTQLGQLWELLPADTRIPDHSIWEHRRITSAIAGALPKPAFLLFTLGPVQEFIATARKTQDLWASSYLLSFLSWTGMKVIAEEFGPDSIIFPDLCGQPFVDKWLIDEKQLKINDPRREELSSPTLPNRFLAIVPEDRVLAIAKEAKAAIKETFKTICNAVKGEMEKKLNINPKDWEEIWNRQGEDFIETYWAATPAKDYTEFLSAYKQVINAPSNWEFDILLKQYEERGFKPNIGTLYSLIYRLTEKSLGSRKSVRDFKQSSEPNYKCTLCGLREPVHPGKFNNQNCSENFGALRGFWQEKVLLAFPQIRKSERLCAICVTKRLSSKNYFRDLLDFDIDDNFPSVSMIATASFKLRLIENISNNDIKTKTGLFIESIKSLSPDRWSGNPIPMVLRACRDEISRDFARLEGDWLYKEAFDNEEELWEENKNRIDRADFKKLLKKAKERQQELFDTIKKIDKGREKDNQIGSPSTYYSVILMDGDNMGKWLSGELAPSISEVMHPIVKNTLENDPEWQELLRQKRPLSPSLHLSMSRALRNFSLHVVREIVEKDHLGKLVYAGGDDVLAFVNLRDLPEVMRKLRAYFSGALKLDEEGGTVEIDLGEGGSGFIPIDENRDAINVGSNKKIKGFMLSMGTKATASMGVVIAHHSSNLSQVLDEVRKCEKEAKKLKDKNAFCIALSKRSGGTDYIKAKWYYNVQNSPFESIPLLRQWIDTFYYDWISPKFVYNFTEEIIGLGGLPKEAVSPEILRIAERQRNKKSKDFDKDKMAKLVEGLINLYKNGHSLEEIGNFLSLADFLGREDKR